ncbi:hypothetical protein GKR75_17525 [Providencia sp. wls1919]|nr:hypothetical protein [Providencia sp. wls1919]
MIYQTGTIATTAGQTKIKGTGTRWKDNLVGISEGCPISIFINNVVYFNNVLSVNSDTEINLTYPVPVAAAAAKYQIATFVLDSMSDGVRKMLANQQYIQYFLRNMDTWMTQDGIVEIKTPTGETVRLESIIALKKLIDGKFDKAGGQIKGSITVTDLITALNGTIQAKSSQSEGYVQIATLPDGSEAMLNSKRPSSPWRKHALQDASGTIMHLGDFGWGGFGLDSGFSEKEITDYLLSLSTKSQIFRYSNAGTFSVGFRYAPIIYSKVANTWNALTADIFGAGVRISSGDNGRIVTYNIWTDKNTTKDTNGNLKAASPIVRVFANDVDPNEEAEGVMLKKLHTGIYQLHGVLGLHSDASWGGINGGITIPCGINQLPLVYALYDVLEKGKPHPFDGRIVEPDEDGDIVLYTTYRKHDLPQNIQYERFKLYPEFLKEVDGEMVELTPGEPCDIPNGHWIDVRVNMPSDSIYNQKLAEAERLAKIEAERVAQEEEAERVAKEETEKLGVN